ncbi:MAG: hypothetical protein ABUT39_03605 [Acidobacteriota bacterium]
MSASRYMVNRSAHLAWRGGTDWIAEPVETWFLGYGPVGSFDLPDADSPASVCRAMARVFADHRDLRLTALAHLFHADRKRKTGFYETIATSHEAILAALSRMEESGRNPFQVSVELAFDVDVDPARERPAFFALDFAAQVLTLSSECWSIFRPDNSREVALAYLADQDLLLESEGSSPELDGITVSTDLAALAGRARLQGGMPVDRETLEFARGCVLVLESPAPPRLRGNQPLSIPNGRRLAQWVSSLGDALGSSWKAASPPWP